jgi:hypothetical protein
MIKAAIDRILGLAPVQRLTIDGREYTDQVIYPVHDPVPAPLQIHTLTGLVDYIAAHKDVLDDLEGETPFFHVISHKEVELRSALTTVFCQRKTFLSATPPESRGYPFGTWLDPESFIIALQAMFVPDEITAQLLALVSSIKEEAVKTSGDDGISQTVTARAGVALVTEVKVPNPVTLRPYRTFMEVEQPAISCVFRLRQGPMLSLHEADGGLWRLEAIKSIKAYLDAAMEALDQKIPVIA